MFAPNEGINQDPVTGSAHTVLIPYWSEKLRKNNFRALQVSFRQGELFCENLGKELKFLERLYYIQQEAYFWFYN